MRKVDVLQILISSAAIFGIALLWNDINVKVFHTVHDLLPAGFIDKAEEEKRKEEKIRRRIEEEEEEEEEEERRIEEEMKRIEEEEMGRIEKNIYINFLLNFYYFSLYQTRHVRQQAC